MLKALALALVVAPQLASAQAPSDQACVADIDGDGGCEAPQPTVPCTAEPVPRRVNVNDLLKLLGQFGSAGVDGEDLDGDGTVNVNDLLQLRKCSSSRCHSSKPA